MNILFNKTKYFLKLFVIWTFQQNYSESEKNPADSIGSTAVSYSGSDRISLHEQ